MLTLFPCHNLHTAKSNIQATAAPQAAANVAAVATATTAASAVVQNFILDVETVFVPDLVVGAINSSFIHESTKGISREFLPEFEASFAEAYGDTLRDVFTDRIPDCQNDLTEDAKFSCTIPCDNPEWCCEQIDEGVLECPFSCSYTRRGEALFEIGGAWAYQIGATNTTTTPSNATAFPLPLNPDPIN